MNVLSVNEDEDFPVFRAGPPLPVCSKGKSQIKPKHAPLKATTLQTTKSSSLTNSGNAIPSGPVAPVSAESKVKQYIERVKASDEVGRKKRIKPEQMLTLEDLYQVKVSNKVEPASPLSANEIHEKLRETMRIVKEKDELINKLRESCHDLAIKCADAENRVDELRFSYGRLSSSAPDKNANHSRGSVCGELPISQPHLLIPRRCVSVENIYTSADEPETNGQQGIQDKDKTKSTQDKATETTNGVKHDVQTQIAAGMRDDDGCNGATVSEDEVGHWRPDDEILMETCSNWLEKVQNWKTDSNFNLSQDSCGDRDSGFRGSAEIEMDSSRKARRASLPKSRKKCEDHGESFLRIPHKATPPSAQIPQLLSSTTITERDGVCSHPNEKSTQHFWPSFSHSSHLQLTSLNYASLHTDSIKSKSLFYELAEAERNKYAHHFKEDRHEHMSTSKSLDVLYMPRALHHNPQDLKSLIDSSFDPPEFILKSHLKLQHNAIDKKMKLLDPLLDDTTKIALRVKEKSERLAKLLQDACTF